MLKEVDTSDRPRQVYCGPYALAALTDLSVGEIEKQINQRRGKKPGASVRWVNGYDLHFAGRQAHLQMGEIEEHFLERKTFARWLRERSPEDANAKYLVLLTGHWVAVEGNEMVDNGYRTPRAIRSCPHRRRLVKLVIRID